MQHNFEIYTIITNTEQFDRHYPGRIKISLCFDLEGKRTGKTQCTCTIVLSPKTSQTLTLEHSCAWMFYSGTPIFLQNLCLLSNIVM